MECEVKVSKANSSQDIYHSCKLLVEQNENDSSAMLVCTMKNSLVPIRVVAKDGVKKVLDSKASINGVATIILSEYHSGGITEMHIRKAAPIRLKDMLTILKKYLTKTATTPCSRKNGMSRGSKMLEASKARTSALSAGLSSSSSLPRPPITSPLALTPLNSSSNFYPSSTTTPTRMPILFNDFHEPSKPHKRSALFPTTITQNEKRPKLDKESPSPPRYTSASPGFVNLGNSCYMNAVLQSLLSIKCFINDVMPAAGTVGHNTLTQQLLLVMESPTRARLSHIRAILCRKGKDLTAFNEQDAQEVLLLCLDIIQNELLQLTDQDFSHIVMKNFELQVEQKLVCSDCGHVNTLNDEIRDITLHINKEGSELQELMLDYFKAETVEYHCETCPCRQFSLSRSIVYLPRVLILTLKRYTRHNSAGKNNTAVRISPSINVSKLISEAVVMAPPPFSESKDVVSSYSLCCVVSHLGTASEYGHYIADVYNEKEWLTYSDKVVRRTTLSDILLHRKCHGYMLLYIRDDCK